MENMKKIIKDFMANSIEHAEACCEVYGANSIECITSQYAVDTLLQLAEDLGIDTDK